MSENTLPPGGNANTRRGFLRTSAIAAGAALLSASSLNTSTLAASPANATPATELTIAVDLLTACGPTGKESGLLLLVVEHVAALAAAGKTQDVALVISEIDRLSRVTRPADLNARLDALRSETREMLAKWATEDAADGFKR